MGLFDFIKRKKPETNYIVTPAEERERQKAEEAAKKAAQEQDAAQEQATPIEDTPTVSIAPPMPEPKTVSVPEAPEAPKDMEALEKEVKAVISALGRFKGNMEDASVITPLMRNLGHVFPSASYEIVAAIPMAQAEEGAKPLFNAISESAFTTNRMLGVSNFESIRKKWSELENVQLLDAFLLLHYYSFILKPEYCENINKAKEMVVYAIEPLLSELKASIPAPAAAATPGIQSFKGMLKPGVEYLVNHNEAKDLYAVEVHDKTGEYISDADWNTDKMGFAAFALTEHEYTLRGRPDNTFTDLLEKLLTELPKDRLLGIGGVVISTKERFDLNIELNCETADDHLYPKYIAAKAKKYIESVGKVYVMYNRSTGENMPAIDGGGFAWAFTKEEYAQTIVEKNPAIDLAYKALTTEEFFEVVKGWYILGVIRFKLNLGTGDHECIVDRDHFVHDEKASKWDYYGSGLNSLIIRFRQNRALEANEDAQKNACMLWAGICHELPKNVFLVPINFDSEPAQSDYDYFHFSKGGFERLNHMAIEKALGDKVDKSKALYATDDKGNPLLVAKEELFYANDRYRFFRPDEVTQPRIMHLRTLNHGNNAFLCAFTDVSVMHKIFGQDVLIGIFTYDEIVAHINDSIMGSELSLEGLVINPGSATLILSRENIEAVRKNNEPRENQ